MKVCVGSGQLVEGISPELSLKVKESLTFDNPKYLAAKKFSHSPYIALPPYVRFYHESMQMDAHGKQEKVLNIPRGFRLDEYSECENLGYEDYRKDSPVDYPDFLMKLRATQEEAFVCYMHLQESRGFHAPSIVSLPTGMGKTILALKIASSLRQKTLVLVHKTDLVEGWKKDISDCFGGRLVPGIIKSKKRKIGEQITIATVQTVNLLSEKERDVLFSTFGLVILDEVHHVGANTFNVVGEFNARYRLGLSATPFRSDGMDYVFDLFFGGIAYKHDSSSPSENDILPVKVFTRYFPAVSCTPVIRDFGSSVRFIEDIKDSLGYSRVEDLPYSSRPRVQFLDVDSHVVLDRRYLIPVCHDILSEYHAGHSCIAFFTQKEHVFRYFIYLSQFVPPSRILLYYGDSRESDSSLIEKAENREALITLATYAKATEGTNVRAWEVGFLVSSLKNEKNVAQAVGRIRRSKEGKLKVARLYDYRVSNAYLIRSHGRARDKVYKELGFDFIPQENKGKVFHGFSRGFGH